MGFRTRKPAPGPRRNGEDGRNLKALRREGDADRRSIEDTGSLPVQAPMVSQATRDAFRREAAPLNGLGHAG